MEEHIPYPSTPSFDNFKRQYLRALTYSPPEDDSKSTDHDEEENLRSRPPRFGTFIGTIKLHGTNASIIYSKGDRHYPRFQARTWVIEEGKDNLGTRSLLSKAPLHELVDEILRIHKGDSFDEIYIAGEIAGKGVQKGVAIAELDRFFAIFNIRIDGNWVDIRDYKSVALPKHRIFNIAQYPIFTLAIDFRYDTKSASDQMEKWTMEVAGECPFGAAFSGRGGKKVSGVGEGIVWTLVESEDKERPLKRDILWNFKTKGEQFSTTAHASKPGTTPRATEGQTKSQKGAVLFADYALTERRFEQGLEHLLLEQSRKGVPESQQNVLNPQLTGTFLNWVTNDAITEERHKMNELGAIEKDVRKESTGRARKWFAQKCREEANKLVLVEDAMSGLSLQ